MEGLILKGVGGFYTVLEAHGETYVCRARGKLRLDDTAPVAGDRVTFACSDGEGDSLILSVLPRKNLLTRPAVANLDKLIVVVALSTPKPDLLLVDKLLLQCELKGIAPVLVLNKSDAAEAKAARDILEQYESTGYALVTASAACGDGIVEVRAEIEGCTCCFAGQSAVGKSSLLNAIVPGLALEVGGMSRKTERGRHTTRLSQLFPACGGVVVDTPGFSLLEAEEIEPAALWRYYPEMRGHGGSCRFPECMHLTEPGCAVKPLVESGRISGGRYERYKILAGELSEKRKHKYD
ncbi:MAG TPA: ribosome small subunit-dependent GTPase A [Clostridia bacterium]|nr:ribosome small subunit-dependent GTPase A [Clostridia bacterium]